mgnify:CR=1 FL=1
MLVSSLSTCVTYGDATQLAAFENTEYRHRYRYMSVTYANARKRKHKGNST